MKLLGRLKTYNRFSSYLIQIRDSSLAVMTSQFLLNIDNRNNELRSVVKIADKISDGSIRGNSYSIIRKREIKTYTILNGIDSFGNSFGPDTFVETCSLDKYGYVIQK